MVKFNNESRPKTKEGKDKKQNAFDSISALIESRELTLNAFQKWNVSNKRKTRKRIKNVNS